MFAQNHNSEENSYEERMDRLLSQLNTAARKGKSKKAHRYGDCVTDYGVVRSRYLFRHPTDLCRWRVYAISHQRHVIVAKKNR